MQVINIKSAVRNYSVNFVESESYIQKLCEIPSRFFVIDENVWRLYGKRFFSNIDPSDLAVLPIHEEKKNLESVMNVYDALLSRAAKRNMTLVSIGGGITQDITGFAASTLYRGINWVFVPTTLLAQADSCIGSKTSLNYRNYKNLVGSFFPPNEIYIHAAYLRTLTNEDFFSGLGEVIKLHLMGGKDATTLFSHRMDAIRERSDVELLPAIQKSLEIKLSYIDGDEFDMGRRHLLNFGHCYGHALEATSQFAVPHGQAVLIGILFANLIARNRGLLKDRSFQQLNDEIILPNVVSTVSQADIRADGIQAAMKMDKKRVGEGLVMVMMLDDYQMTKVTDVTLNEIARASDELGNLLNAA